MRTTFIVACTGSLESLRVKEMDGLPQELRLYIMISSERMHKPDKLAAIRIGDLVTYEREGELIAQQVHGWRLTVSGHHAIVGSSQYGREHEVSLSTVISRHRDKG